MHRTNNWWRGCAALVFLACVAVVGCDSEMGDIFPNEAPNTRISSGPPELSDTGYQVPLFWFGFDTDGEVSHYEIAWEDTTEWLGPIFGNDSTFTVAAAETCCVDPLPDFGDPNALNDEVYEEFHTFFVRAVDDDGEVDPTPASRSFNSKTVAPYVDEITFGPSESGRWGTLVIYKWIGNDDDGLVVGYEVARSRIDEWRLDNGLDPQLDTIPLLGRLVDWIDTLQYRPVPGGYDFDDPMWKFTDTDSAVFELNPNRRIPPGFDQYIFAVRAVDDAGARETRLDQGINFRLFVVDTTLGGPRIEITSNIAGTFNRDTRNETREVFLGQGLRFRWRAFPGDSQTPIAGFSFAPDDTTQWSPFSLNTEEWPEQIEDEDEVLWFPTVGVHTFFVRAIDEAGFLALEWARVRIFGGPRTVPADSLQILVVTDSATDNLVADSVLPENFAPLERVFVETLFEGYDFTIFDTDGGQDRPAVSEMNRSSSIFWFHTTDALGNGGNVSALRGMHEDPPNPLPSYIASGGNFFLCGVRPAGAIAFEDDLVIGNVVTGSFNPSWSPEATLGDDDIGNHWAATQLGIRSIARPTSNTNSASQVGARLRLAKSRVEGYPDLVFDPLRWPRGPEFGGFGYYDVNVTPLIGNPAVPVDADTLYTFNDTDIPIAVRKVAPGGPGINGNTVYMGFHPYFVDQPAVEELIRKVLTDFGERPVPGAARRASLD